MNSLEEKTPVNEKTMREMLVDLFFFCMHNSTDFLLAGYPFDLTLFDLSKVSSIREPFEKLSKALIEGLNEGLNDGQNPSLCADLIILAHWKSQSFYQEMYTDIFDFCFCLKKKLEQYQPPGEAAPKLLEACDDLMTALSKEWTRGGNGHGEKFIVCSEFAGPEYQYAHGLSVYFPWSRPPADRRILEEYRRIQDRRRGV